MADEKDHQHTTREIEVLVDCYILKDLTEKGREEIIGIIQQFLNNSVDKLDFVQKIRKYFGGNTIEFYDKLTKSILSNKSNAKSINKTEPPSKSYLYEDNYVGSRHIIYLCGMNSADNEIMTIYDEFRSYGEIKAIYTNKVEGYALIQFYDLVSVFNSVSDKKEHFHNQFLKIGYATNVDKTLENLSALQYNRSKRKMDSIMRKLSLF